MSRWEAACRTLEASGSGLDGSWNGGETRYAGHGIPMAFCSMRKSYPRMRSRVALGFGQKPSKGVGWAWTMDGSV